jgi:flagellar basal body-associated protein FliL
MAGNIGRDINMEKKKAILIATFIVIAAVAIVLCFGYFTGKPADEYDGILVRDSISLFNIL